METISGKFVCPSLDDLVYETFSRANLNIPFPASFPELPTSAAQASQFYNDVAHEPSWSFYLQFQDPTSQATLEEKL